MEEESLLTVQENKFFYTLVSSGNLSKAYEEGFSTGLIVSTEGTAVLQTLISYSEKFNKLPSKDRFSRAHPDIVLKTHSDNLSETIKDLQDQRVIELVTKSIKNTATTLQKTRSGSLTKDQCSFLIAQEVRKLPFIIDSIEGVSKDINICSDDFLSVYTEELSKRKSLGGMLGYEYPWPTVNKSTKGLCNTQLVAILARTGVGKTWFLIKTALHLWRRHDVPVLVVSNEISGMGMSDRFVSIASKVPYSNIRSGETSPEMDLSIQSFFNDLKERNNFIITGNDGMSSGGISSIESKIKRYGAKVLFVDGAYLVDDDLGGSSRSDRAANVARGLKKLGKRLNIPVVISWQLNRQGSKSKGGGTEDVGLTDVLSADSDLLMSLSRTEDMELNGVTCLSSVKTRESQPFEITCKWDFNDMDFSEVEEPDFETDVVIEGADEEIIDNTSLLLFSEKDEIDV